MNYWQISLLKNIGFQTVESAMAKKKESGIIPVNPEELTEKERERYDFLMKVAHSEYGNFSSRMHVGSSMPDTEAGKLTMGFYDPILDCVFLYRGLLDENRYELKTLLGVMDHEVRHRESGADDRTRDFESALTYRIGELLELKYDEKGETL